MYTICMYMSTTIQLLVVMICHGGGTIEHITHILHICTHTLYTLYSHIYTTGVSTPTGTMHMYFSPILSSTQHSTST